MLCYAMLCYAMLCYAVLCYDVLIACLLAVAERVADMHMLCCDMIYYAYYMHML